MIIMIQILRKLMLGIIRQLLILVLVICINIYNKNDDNASLRHISHEALILIKDSWYAEILILFVKKIKPKPLLLWWISGINQGVQNRNKFKVLKYYKFGWEFNILKINLFDGLVCFNNKLSILVTMLNILNYRTTVWYLVQLFKVKICNSHPRQPTQDHKNTFKHALPANTRPQTCVTNLHQTKNMCCLPVPDNKHALPAYVRPQTFLKRSVP